ncbi:IS3 family transposase [Flagellimonas onchidii]|uniref:IS3 family transposase n=1 Tax=Flagellimonas onchidii TaxID=2562684 RepID=UPI001455E4E7|nr:IS3 family transposase [Allomuricauda onchidii]
MELMDRHAATFPAEGVLSMVNMLAGKGYRINHKRARRLLRKMGHRTLYPKKYLSKLGLT